MSEAGNTLKQITDRCIPWCLHVTVTLRIAEHMTVGHSQIDDLARVAERDSHCLQAMLRHPGWVSRNTPLLTRETTVPLRRCAEAARPNGKVVLLSVVRPDRTRSPLTIEMALLAGKHRSLSEFRELASAAGLNVQSAAHSERYFIVECNPV